MCRCTDMVCAQRVSEEMTQWSHEQENGEYRKALKLSEDDNRRAAALAERMTKCMQDAMMNSQAGSAAPTP